MDRYANSDNFKQGGAEKVNHALLKKALGFSVEEINEEYNFVDDQPVLAKRKRNVKYYPPDLASIQIALENFNNLTALEGLSIEELEAEKTRLIKSLTSKRKG